uniref:Putative capsid protein n=1 Tax=viral metagenome TaxID=1070528 RepID=A0A6M3K3J3_9ZZZZ
MALTYNEVDAHVREKYIPVLVDQFYSSTPFMAQLMSKNRVVYDSGAKIDQPVLYGDLPNGWYTGLDTFDISTRETTTLAKFEWKQSYVDVTIDGTTELKVEGDEKVLSIVETKMENASKTFTRMFSQALFATSQLTNAVHPLVTAIATTGTYGEIAKGTYSWWQGNVNTTGGAFDMNMLQSMYGDCSDGVIQPDLIITTQNIYDKIWLRVSVN